jgi:hypothetical protein
MECMTLLLAQEVLARQGLGTLPGRSDFRKTWHHNRKLS